MATQTATRTGGQPAPGDEYFRVTDQVPAQVWYWAALASIVASAGLRLAGQRDWSLFVGQWPPTFLLLGLFHKLVGQK